MRRFRIVRNDSLEALSPAEQATLAKWAKEHPDWERPRGLFTLRATEGGAEQRWVAPSDGIAAGLIVEIAGTWEAAMQSVSVTADAAATSSELRAAERLAPVTDIYDHGRRDSAVDTPPPHQSAPLTAGEAAERPQRATRRQRAHSR